MGFSHYGRRGVVISADKESDRKTEARLYSCVHCGFTWVRQPGSGIKRGFCQNCMGDVCGRASCVVNGCLHWEKEIEAMERGIAPDQMPIIVAVEGMPPKD